LCPNRHIQLLKGVGIGHYDNVGSHDNITPDCYMLIDTSVLAKLAPVSYAEALALTDVAMLLHDNGFTLLSDKLAQQESP